MVEPDGYYDEGGLWHDTEVATPQPITQQPPPSWGGVQYETNELGAEGVVSGAEYQRTVNYEQDFRTKTPELVPFYERGKQTGDFEPFNQAVKSYNEGVEVKRKEAEAKNKKYDDY